MLLEETSEATGQTAGQTTLDPRLRRFLRWAVLLLTAGYTFLDYWAYSAVEHAGPQAWQRLAEGQGIAPAQYRIGVYGTANFLKHHSHLQFRHIFAVSDFLCTGLGLAFLFFLLTRTFGFRRLDLPRQWSRMLLALLLVQVYLVWTLWFQQPETMPSFFVLAASALLCSGLIRLPRAVLTMELLVLALIGATVRIDAIVAFHAGMLLACLPARGENVPWGRKWQVGASALSLVLALAIAHSIAHDLFPHAVRDAALVQLSGNIQSWNGALALACTLPVWGLTVWLARKRWAALDGWARGLAIGSGIHCAMFFTFGMSEEVRIFLPFALTLLPLSAPLLLDWFQGEPVSGLAGLATLKTR